MQIITYILPFLILFVIVTFVHEYGHYYFAKRYGVKVTVFSPGTGKELFGWTDKAGVRWKLSPIPLACYVKFYGDHSIFSGYFKIITSFKKTCIRIVMRTHVKSYR